jgi:amidase
MDEQLAFAPALEQAALIRAGEVSSSELVELYLRRIENLNPALGAYLTVAADVATSAAKEADARLGEDGLPPFHGVPISIKDLSETAGIRTTHGAAAWHDRVPDFDDEHVSRIKRAGFVILGKTVTPELGPVNVSEPPGYPPGRNPWNPDRSCGGSSGGAAAAIAAGLCPVSQGSDAGGSIRNPAAWCGVFGLKPARGRVSSAPRMNDLLAIVGPLSRTVADAAALLDVLAGPATGDLFWAPPPPRPFLDEVGVDPGRQRVALATDPGAGIPVTTALREAARGLAALLQSQGHIVEEAQPPVVGAELMVALQVLFCGNYAGRELEGTLPPIDTLSTWMQTMIAAGRGLSAADYTRAQRVMQAACREVVAFFDRYDLLVTPTVAAPPPLVGAYADIDLTRVAELWALTPFTGMWNTTGQPAVSIPWSLDEDRLPVGVQVVGPPVGEAALLRVAAQIEQARPWHDWRPPLS